MMRDIIFIGGIHGVGKGVICHEISMRTNRVHKTASDVLKWKEISEPSNKKVDNIQSTQDRLIEGINNTFDDAKSYLLDGHFCLFNSEGDITKVPMKTFKEIAPKLIAVVTNDINVIKERLGQRDGKAYGADELRDMQATEIEYAKQVSSELNIPLVEIKDGDYQSLIRVM